MQGRQAAGLTTATAVRFVRPILGDEADPEAHYQIVGSARARVMTITAGDRPESVTCFRNSEPYYRSGISRSNELALSELQPSASKSRCGR